MGKNKLIFGWGINDVNYPVCKYEELPVVDGKRKQKCVWECPYYRKWRSIIKRCFSTKLQEKYPTYKGCSITEDWKRLSNFIIWVDNQPNKDWRNSNLDKDFLVSGNKHYSPETCVFISSVVNTFIIDSGRARGKYMIGVSAAHNSIKNPYKASCGNPFTNKGEYLGLFPTELEAHLAWKTRKHELALHLASIELDLRVASRLREMYELDKDLTKI